MVCSSRKKLLLAFVCALFSIQASATIITIEPDDYSEGTDISNPVAGVSLSAPMYQTGSASILSRTVGSDAPTGERVFGTSVSASFVLDGGVLDNIFVAIENCINGSEPGVPNSSLCRNGGSFLVVAFDNPTDLVSISARVGSDSAILNVYGADGNRLEWVADAANFPDDPNPIRNLQIARTQRDIAYLAAYGESTGGVLDNLQFNEVPIPAAAWLFGSALLGLGIIKRRKR